MAAVGRVEPQAFDRRPMGFDDDPGLGELLLQASPRRRPVGGAVGIATTDRANGPDTGSAEAVDGSRVHVDLCLPDRL
jgi:hypothetical protein